MKIEIRKAWQVNRGREGFTARVLDNSALDRFSPEYTGYLCLDGFQRFWDLQDNNVHQVFLSLQAISKIIRDRYPHAKVEYEEGLEWVEFYSHYV